MYSEIFNLALSSPEKPEVQEELPKKRRRFRKVSDVSIFMTDILKDSKQDAKIELLKVIQVLITKVGAHKKIERKNFNS